MRRVRLWVGGMVLAMVTLLGLPSAPAHANTSRVVMAYYYGWWNHLSWAPARMSDRPPELYEGGNTDVMRRQIQQAKSAGIDGFICTWRYTCAKLLQVAESEGNFKVAFSVDPVGDPTLGSDSAIRTNMREMMGYMSSPAYWNYQGKPVFVFWNDTILPGGRGSLSDWNALRSDIDPNRQQFWLGGGVNFGLLDVFDALHFYDITWEISSGKAMSSYNRKLGEYNSSRGASKPFFATVMPGYDDTRYRNGHYKDRAGGDYYRSSWDNARAYAADVAIITSWNEWFEGSSIEPSNNYGTTYLDITREKIAEFKDPTPPIPSGYADRAIKTLWERADLAVSQQRVARSWVWGPALADGRYEAYNGGTRVVQYFDKARMEINNPAGDRASQWFVTNGLLVTEMINGRIQTGESSYETRSPSTEVLAGDPREINPNAPSYATLAIVTPYQPNKTGEVLRTQLRGGGDLVSITPPVSVANAFYVPETGHNIPDVFWQYLNQQGVVYSDSRYTNAALFDWVFAFGYPISDAYWMQVNIGGVPQWTLVQAFERRILTYTPSNPAGYQVEMGNVGQHYYRWRYGQ